jgi:acyl-CoA synthetase (NDP forming)
VSIGNEAGAGIGQLGQLLLDDPATDGFLLFMETIRDRDALAAFARGAAERGKPVVAHMIDRSDEGPALSVSHTRALTGTAEAVSAFLESIGIRQAESLDTLMDTPRLLSKMRLPAHRTRRPTVLTTTGGAMLVDQVSARGVEIAGCSGPTREALTAENIPLSHGKLVDVILAGTKYDTMKEVVSRLIAGPETGACSSPSAPRRSSPPSSRSPRSSMRWPRRPVTRRRSWRFPLPHAPESLDLLAAGGVPAFRNVEACAETIAMLMRPVNVTAPPATSMLVDQSAKDVLNEERAGAAFESLGIPRPRQIVLPPEDAQPGTLDLRFPLVSKLVSSDLPHKTEAGAIRLGLADRAALEEAIAAMRASAEAHAPGYRLEGILLQEMARGSARRWWGLPATRSRGRC